MHNIHRIYRGLTGQSQIMLSNASELSFLATGERENIRDFDHYYGTARIEFANGTIFEVFIQEEAGIGGEQYPAYLALKNSQGNAIPSSLWPSEEINSDADDLSLLFELLETEYV